jgi:hypothetical protein
LRFLPGCWPNALPIMSLRLIMPTWPPIPGMSNGIDGASFTSISTSAEFRLPSEKR